MNTRTLKYELSSEVVNYILMALNRVSITGIKSAGDLKDVVNILQNPINSDELEKEQYESLKNKFEEKTDKKKS